QLVEGPAYVVVREPHVPRRSVVAEQDDAALLVRWSARHARSRSTRTGFGDRTSSTTSVGRPESRSAASRPSETAVPCVTPWYDAAASSACANVCPRLRM